MKTRLLLLLLLPVLSFGQHQFGLYGGGGMSILQHNLTDTEFITYNSKYHPSGNLGVYYSYGFNKMHGIGIGVYACQITGGSNQNYYAQYTTNAGGETTVHSIPTGTGYSRQYFSYVNLPVYYQFSLSRFNLRLGVLNALAVRTSSYGYSDIVLFPEGERIVSETTSKTKIDFYNYGINAEFGVQLSEKIEVHLGVNQWMNNILQKELDPFFIEPWRIRQITAGIRFNVLSK